MTDTLANVAHVVPGGVAGRLEELGAERIIEFPDTLSHGPSRRDPKRHRELRLSYWRGLYERLLGEGRRAAAEEATAALEEGYLSAEQLGSVMAHHADERRVVIWSTPTFEDRLFLWMAFEAWRLAEIPTDRMATAEPKFAVGPDEDDHFALRDLELDEIAEGFDALVYPEDIYVQAGRQLWQTFASASPRKFAISVPHTEKFFPEIEQLAESYGAMFPSVAGEGAERMYPSRFDAELLEAVDPDEWRTAYEILGEPFVEEFHFVDDLAIAARLVDWSRTGGGSPYVESRVEDPEGGPLDRLAFRRSERATRLCADGFGDGDDAPVLELGDCRIYAGAEPWVRVVEDEFWWFERFESDDSGGSD